MTDPIVDEVRRVRDAHAAMFNYDLDAIFLDIKEQEKKSGLKFVSYPPRRIEASQALTADWGRHIGFQEFQGARGSPGG